jgi:hypothetical protein
MATIAKKPHHYQVALVWEGNLGTGTSDYTAYGRQYRVGIAGKPDLLGSADPMFRSTLFGTAPLP